jgi:hypothetical protein
MRENREILARYESAFGKPATLIKTRCFGKWAGTTDYSVKIGDSTLSIGNSSAGQEFLNKRIVNIIEAFEKFDECKADILQKIESLKLFDDALADKMGLQKYEILDVDFARSGSYIGWFYITLKIGDSVVRHLETGFDCAVRRVVKNREFATGKKEYYTAGGLADSMVDFVFLGTGFSTKTGMYTLKG